MGTGKRPQTGEPILPVRRAPPPEVIEALSLTSATSTAPPDATRNLAKTELRDDASRPSSAVLEVVDTRISEAKCKDTAPNVEQSSPAKDVGVPIHLGHDRHLQEHVAEAAATVSSAPERTKTVSNAEQMDVDTLISAGRLKGAHEYIAEAREPAPATALQAAEIAATADGWRGSSLMIQVPNV